MAVLTARGIAAAADAPPPYSRVVGIERTYRVKRGDTLARVAAVTGQDPGRLAAANHLADPKHLRPGSELVISDLRIVPDRAEATGQRLVINLGERAVYWLEDDAVRERIVVAIGKRGWETPVGEYSVTGRRLDPVWHVPKSIQREMARKGLPVKTTVPPGRDNPLGRYWISLSASGVGLHGTNQKTSLGRSASHGCIRFPDGAIERLFHELPDGAPVAIINEPVKLAHLPDGRVLLEVHPDAYPEKGRASREDHVEQMASAAGIPPDRLDWERVRRALPKAWGVALDVTAD